MKVRFKEAYRYLASATDEGATVIDNRSVGHKTFWLIVFDQPFLTGSAGRVTSLWVDSEWMERLGSALWGPLAAAGAGE